ncbi:hypothetical protein BROUX41_001428 [Berkeleyomyces rouxiae]
MASFDELFRFIAKNGKTYFGNAILRPGSDDIAKASQAHIITGDIFSRHDVTDEIADIHLLLVPLASEQVRTVRCIGLNYSKHAQEASMKLPEYPVLFPSQHKPQTALTGPRDSIPVPPVAQTAAGGLDYECELVVVISKSGSDISPAAALNHVLGYAVGNDVSHREWQLQHDGGQWCHGKGFDGWAPFGPGLVAPSVLADPQGLHIWTKVNGAVLQDGNTADMVFSVRDLVSFLSRGVTLLAGDIIYTGTPSGVALGRKPQPWLKNGDVVEVGLQGVGTCVNKVEWTSKQAKL